MSPWLIASFDPPRPALVVGEHLLGLDDSRCAQLGPSAYAAPLRSSAAAAWSTNAATIAAAGCSRVTTPTDWPAITDPFQRRRRSPRGAGCRPTNARPTGLCGDPCVVTGPSLRSDNGSSSILAQERREWAWSDIRDQDMLRARDASQLQPQLAAATAFGCETAMICALERDNRDLLSGDLTPEEWHDRATARAFGGVVGILGVFGGAWLGVPTAASLAARPVTTTGGLRTTARVARQLSSSRGYIPVQAIL